MSRYGGGLNCRPNIDPPCGRPDQVGIPVREAANAIGM